MMQTLRLAGVALGVVLAVLSTSPLQAQERFRPAGTVVYEPTPATEQIGSFEILPENSRIRSLRFRVEEGQAEIRSFRVRYRDGESERFTIRETFEAGERTEIFELEDVRRVRSIDIAYTPRGRVKIALLVDGRRAEPEPPPPPPPAAWNEIACNFLTFLNDNDVVRLPAPTRLTALRLRANRFDIMVNNIRVRFNDGTSERLTVGTVVPAGARTNAIDLRAGGRRVSEIELNYGSTGFGTSPATMCVDGNGPG